MAKLVEKASVEVSLFDLGDGKFQVVATCEGKRGAYTPQSEHRARVMFEMLKHHDCPKCGGTGINHYYSWKECWSCGDDKKDGKSSGKSTTKEM